MRQRNFNLKAVSFNLRDLISLIKTYSSIIMLFSLFACGLIIGTLTIKNSEYCRYLLSVFITENNEIIRMLINSIFAVITVLTVNFIMGLCLVGSVFISFLSVIVGIFFGSFYSYQLYMHGNDGIGRFLLTDVLFFVLLYVIFICSQCTSVSMSDSLKHYYCNHKANANLRSYLIRTSVYYVLSILLVIMQSFIKAAI